MALSIAAAKAKRLFGDMSARAVNMGLRKSDVLTTSLNAYFLFSGYSHARTEGYGVASSIMRGAAEAALIDVVGWQAYFGYLALSAGPKAIMSGAEALGRQSRQLARERHARPFQNNTFIDTRQNYTMRQAGMQLAQQSRYNLQHAMLGNEAQYLHR